MLANTETKQLNGAKMLHKLNINYLPIFTKTPSLFILSPNYLPSVLDSLWKSLSSVQLFATLWTTVHGILQARILEWVAFPFSRGSSQRRDQTQVSHIAGGFFTWWVTREAQEVH